jgi:hypothetical protein
MKKALRSSLLNLSRHLHLITPQQLMKVRRLQIESAVSSAGGAQTGNVCFFKNAER